VSIRPRIARDAYETCRGAEAGRISYKDLGDECAGVRRELGEPETDLHDLADDE
jgi:hypothetical protein